jgi:hypothetical protein
MPLIRWWSAYRPVVLIAALVACGDSFPIDPDAVRPVHVIGDVRDPQGTPVRDILVTWQGWPAPDPTSGSVPALGRTDELGRFVAQIGYYDEPLLDSVEVSVAPGKCWGFAPLAIRERALEIRPGTGDTVATLHVTLERTAAPGRLVIGPICAPIIVPDGSGLENRLTLRIDEIADSVRGRWDINFDESRGDDWGRFSGARVGNTLVLDLRHEEPWGTCTGYTVEIPIEGEDALGIGTYGSQGCAYAPAPLRFVEGAPREWPFE